MTIGVMECVTRHVIWGAYGLSRRPRGRSPQREGRRVVIRTG